MATGLECWPVERRSVLISSLVAFAIVLAVDFLYVTLINAQGASDDMPYVPRFIAGFLALMAALIVIALMPRKEIVAVRVPMRAAAAAGLLGIGLLGAMTIGLPLVAAGILAAVALGRTDRVQGSWRRRLAGLLAAIASIAVLLVGIDAAERVIVCPQFGTSGGGGTYLLGGSYRYECNNGELHMTSG